MITSLFFGMILNVVKQVISILPVGDPVPQGFIDTFAWLSEQLGKLGSLFPVETLVQVIAVTVAINIGLWTYQGVKLLYFAIRG